jgi:nitrogen fixation NifU-like protein
MYRDEILDLYRNPRNLGKIQNPEITEEGDNPSCGDHTQIYANLENDEISELKHETEACAICTASISILSEEVKDLSKDEILGLDRDWMLEKLGIEVSPIRMKCALLGLKTLQKGVKEE